MNGVEQTHREQRIQGSSEVNAPEPACARSSPDRTTETEADLASFTYHIGIAGNTVVSRRSSSCPNSNNCCVSRRVHDTMARVALMMLTVEDDCGSLTYQDNPLWYCL